MSGYLHPTFAESFSEFGEPLPLPKCKGWIIKRNIPDFPYFDAIGCYPLFSCQYWSEIQYDLDHNIDDDIVCLSLVTDPFAEINKKYLESCFKDVVLPFKEHFVADLDKPINEIVSSHHRRYTRKALKELKVEAVDRPIDYLDEWIFLYDLLVKKHHIKGIRAFSKSAFEKQLQVPGTVLFRSSYGEKTTGMHIWYVQGNIAHGHLGSYTTEGLNLFVSYAIFWHVLQHFKEMGLKWANFGGGAGTTAKANDGLTDFKKGWSTDTKTTFFCGRIFDKEKYSEILEKKKISDISYFPPYRKGEFD